MLFPLASPLKIVGSLEDKVLLILKEVFTCNITHSMAYLRGVRNMSYILQQKVVLHSPLVRVDQLLGVWVPEFSLDQLQTTY